MQQTQKGFQRARKANRPNAIEEQEAYKEARRIIRIAIRKCKTDSWKNLIETISSDPWGLPYKIVMDKLRRSRGSSVPEDEESLRKILEVLFPTGGPRTSFPNQEHREAGEPFSPQELKAAASRLSPGKSPGLDGIPNEVVRLIAKKNSQMLMSVFNKCLEEGIFPNRWKRQQLILIPESTQAMVTDPSSFRPLRMIDSTGKLFERLILNRMEKVFGFRKRLSTHHALKKVKESVSEALYELRSLGGFCIIIALDVKNAFNSASWECIYQSLAEEKSPWFEINGEVIALKQEIKYLGVWLDSKWSFLAPREASRNEGVDSVQITDPT